METRGFMEPNKASCSQKEQNETYGVHACEPGNSSVNIDSFRQKGWGQFGQSPVYLFYFTGSVCQMALESDKSFYNLCGHAVWDFHYNTEQYLKRKDIFCLNSLLYSTERLN